jgi:hypothetical protein
VANVLFITASEDDIVNVETFWNKDEFKLISRTCFVIDFIFLNKWNYTLPGSSNMAASLPREIYPFITPRSSVETGCRSPS